MHLEFRAIPLFCHFTIPPFRYSAIPLFLPADLRKVPKKRKQQVQAALSALSATALSALSATRKEPYQLQGKSPIMITMKMPGKQANHNIEM